MRRKLGLEEAMVMPPAYPREPVSKAEGEEEAAPSLVLDRVRRNRTTVNYPYPYPYP